MRQFEQGILVHVCRWFIRWNVCLINILLNKICSMKYIYNLKFYQLFCLYKKTKKRKKKKEKRKKKEKIYNTVKWISLFFFFSIKTSLFFLRRRNEYHLTSWFIKKGKKNPRILNLRTPNWKPSFLCSIRFVTRFNLEAL